MVQITWQRLAIVASVLLYSTEQHRVLSKRSRSGWNDQEQWSQLFEHDQAFKIEVAELRREVSGLRKENDLSKRLNENMELGNVFNSITRSLKYIAHFKYD